MPKIVTYGRTDTSDYFKYLDDALSSGPLKHAPLITFTSSEDEVRVRVVDKLSDLLALNDDTPVMSQWPGEWRSDFFQFTVGKYRQFIKAKNQPLKSARNAVKKKSDRKGDLSLCHMSM